MKEMVFSYAVTIVALIGSILMLQGEPNLLELFGFATLFLIACASIINGVAAMVKRFPYWKDGIRQRNR